MRNQLTVIVVVNSEKRVDDGKSSAIVELQQSIKNVFQTKQFKVIFYSITIVISMVFFVNIHKLVGKLYVPTCFSFAMLCVSKILLESRLIVVVVLVLVVKFEKSVEVG